MGEDLIFSLSAVGNGSGTVTPFAVAPDGRIFTGVPDALAPGPNESLNLGVFVDDPVFGSYQVGVQIRPSGAANVSYQGFVATASRDNSQTQVQPNAVTFTFSLAQRQVALPFAYGPPETNIP